MKFALVIPDGCSDEPQAALGGRTPLQAALIPHMDEVARRGIVGRSDNVPPSLPSGSDVATMNLFGYDPLVYHTGRAPLEAAAQGIPLGPCDWAIRCNFVTIENGRMVSFTAGQIPTALAADLIALLQQQLGGSEWEFHAGVSYRNLLIHRPVSGASPLFAKETHTTPPHDLTDQPIADDLPSGPGGEILRRFMNQSAEIVRRSAANEARRKEGAHPATGIWLWGQGQRPAFESFESRFGKRGAMITAVDLLRGIASLLGWKNIQVPGATGYLDTDYTAKGQYAIRALDDADLVIVHVEATDEASHEGDALAKVDALERIDSEIVGPLHAQLRARGEYRFLISPDHPTFLRTKTHSYGYVPFAMCGTGVAANPSVVYDEATAARSSHVFDRGCELMPYFLR